MTRVPFGQDCAWEETFGITRAATQIVTALVSAEVTGRSPTTLREVNEIIECEARNGLVARLERSGWIVSLGRNAENEKLWRPTPRAWRELGLVGWTFWDGPSGGPK